MVIELSLQTTSEEGTEALGVSIGEALHDSVVIAMYGEMGSGKTTFVRGLAKGLGVTGVVNSPTYTLMQRYEGRLTLDHYDAWMEGRERDVLADGAHELLGLGGVSVIEWADRVEDLLPDERLEIRLLVTGTLDRDVTLRWLSTNAEAPGGLSSLGVWDVPDES
jgi:tRNA threonylcarbamoyladenosine biosynthesis protein TsaE